MALRWNCTAIMAIVQKICIAIAIVMRQLHRNCLNFSLDMQQLQLFCEAIVNVFEAIAIVLQSNCNCFAKQLQLFCEAIAIVLQSNCNCFTKQLLKVLIFFNGYAIVMKQLRLSQTKHSLRPIALQLFRDGFARVTLTNLRQSQSNRPIASRSQSL